MIPAMLPAPSVLVPAAAGFGIVAAGLYLGTLRPRLGAEARPAWKVFSNLEAIRRQTKNQAIWTVFVISAAGALGLGVAAVGLWMNALTAW